MDELETKIWECLLGINATQDEIVEGVMGKDPAPETVAMVKQALETLQRRCMVVATICTPEGQKYTAVTRRWYDTRMILWDGPGWYQYNVRFKSWKKVYVVCHFNKCEIRYIEEADCFDVSPSE